MPPRSADQAQASGVHDERKARSRKDTGEPKRTRTKTGCLTCRKRRIKCDEGRPICLNCVKSRRTCDGYKTPVILLSSAGESFGSDDGLDQYDERGDDSYYGANHASHVPNFAEHSHLTSAAPLIGVPIPCLEATRTEPTLTVSPFSFDGSDCGCFPLRYDYDDQFSYSLSMQDHSGRLDINGYTGMDDQIRFHEARNNTTNVPASFACTPFNIPTMGPDYVSDSSRSINTSLPQSHSTTEHHSPSSYPTQLSTPQSLQALPDFDVESYAFHENYQLHDRDHATENTETGLHDGNTYSEEEGVFQFNRNEEEHERTTLSNCWVRNVPIAAQPTLDVDVYSGKRISPLTDGYMRSVFKHFITTTGAMVTAHDRSSPFNSPLVDKEQTPSAHAGLWTFTLPMMALENQGLLYGMMALASLQLAKADGLSTTSSLKHYIDSLNRVHSAVRDERTRHHVTTLAATLLLAFYEVATAEHNRWNLHLAGAAQLIREADFLGMTRQMRLMRSASLLGNSTNDHNHFKVPLAQHFFDLDVPLVSALVGETIDIDARGVLHRHGHVQEQTRSFSHKDLADYEIMRDLFWWYVRQDMIHSLVGGKPLLLDYDDWTDCPPRSPIGLGLAHFGTFDHLLLLLGRLVRFADRDRPRKIRIAEAVVTGSRTHQPSTSVPNKNTHTNSSSPKKDLRSIPRRLSKTNDSKSNPISYGMSCNAREPRMPLAYQVHSPSPIPSYHPENTNPDLSSATAHAWDEWNSIRAAFDVFAAALGPDYQPLPDSPTHPPFDSPFGNAFHYRTNGIACVAAWFHMGLLFALQVQPSMPPAATAAVGAAASPQTAQLATTIGRIVAGIRPDLSSRPLRPTDAGAACDTFVPLFFAGAQYRDPRQRRWTVEWLRRTEATTGWASIGLCAHGCESAWVRAAEMGKGPPYQRTMGFTIGERVGSDEVEVKREEGGGADCGSAGGTGMVHAGDEGFFRFRRGPQVMTTYSLYTSTTDEFSRLALTA